MTGSRISFGSCSDSTVRLGAPGRRTSVSAIARVLVATDPRLRDAARCAKPIEGVVMRGYLPWLSDAEVLQ